MIIDVNERNEREICEFGRVLTDDEREAVNAKDEKADATAAELRSIREHENRERELHREQTGHYPTQLPCLKCQAEKMHKRDGAEPQQLHGDAIECPQCKHVMLKAEVADYRAHGQNCVAYEIRTRRNEATLAELSKRLVDAEKCIEMQREAFRTLEPTKRGWQIDELNASLLALATYMLEPGECLAPDDCGGCDLCPCRTDGHFHGTCGINETLVQMLNEHIDKHPAPWRYHKANEKHGTSEATDPERHPSHWSGTRPIDLARAHDPGGPHANAGAAEPECEAPASTQRCGGEPERASGSDPGVPGA